MEENIKRLIEYSNIIGNKNIDSSIINENTIKNMHRVISKNTHPDYIKQNSQEQKENAMKEFSKLFPEITLTGSIDENLSEIFKFHESAIEEYNSKDKIKESEEDKTEIYNRAFEKYDKDILKIITENPKLKNILEPIYKQSRNINTKDQLIAEIAEQKKVYKIRCENIVKNINDYRKKLSNLGESLKTASEYDKECNESITKLFNDIIKNFNDTIRNSSSFDKIKESYYGIYEQLSKLLNKQQLLAEINKNQNNNPADYAEIMSSLEYELDKINIKRYEQSEKLKAKKISPIEKLDAELMKLLAKHKVKAECHNLAIGYFNNLKNIIEKDGFTIDEVKLGLEKLLKIENVEDCNICYKKLLSELPFKLYKLNIIKEIKLKASKLPESAIPQDINNTINDINNCNIGSEIDALKEPIIRRLNYSLYVNNSINEYLEEISNNPNYSFSLGDIKTELDELRNYFKQSDFKYEFFNIEFRIRKEKFKKKATVDLINANEKKNKLKSEFAKCYEENVFLSGTEEQVQEKIDNVRTFGEFSGLENKIILTELKKQMNILVPKLTNTKEKIFFEIRALKTKNKKSNDPFIIDFVSRETSIAVKEKKERCDYIDQALECFATICEMFDRSENFNNMIIYPEAEFVKKDKNRESFKQALKQSVDLINLDFENDSLEQISTVINRIYRELLLNEKRMAKELKILNEATKNNREKLRR